MIPPPGPAETLSKQAARTETPAPGLAPEACRTLFPAFVLIPKGSLLPGWVRARTCPVYALPWAPQARPGLTATQGILVLFITLRPDRAWQSATSPSLPCPLLKVSRMTSD